MVRGSDGVERRMTPPSFVGYSASPSLSHQEKYVSAILPTRNGFPRQYDVARYW